MTGSSEPPRELAGAGFVIPLAAVSLVTVAGIVLFTHGRSHQVAAEARIGALREVAGTTGVPVDALVAAIVLEGYRDEPRSDRDVARTLAMALAKTDDIEGALATLTEDVVEARMVVDLWKRNRERWLR